MELSKNLAAISRYLRRCRHRYMEPYGLKSIHGRLLVEVQENPGISQDGLTLRLGFDKSNVARQAAYLEEQGFLERRQGQDKRVLQLYVTEKTEALLPGLRENMEQREQALLAKLTEQEQAQLLTLLEKLRWGAEGEDKE